MAGAPRILIFDLDGTLVDTMGPAADLFCEMLLAECGVPDKLSRPIFTQLMGKGPRAQFAAVLRHLEATDGALVDDLTRRYWLRDDAHAPALFPEVLDVLEGLRQEDHTLVISSGSIPSSVRRKIRATGIESLFRLALGSDEDVPGLAKGPCHFALICDAVGITHERLQANGVFIGDGRYDMEVASNTGIPAIGRLTGDNGDVLMSAGAQLVIRDLHELKLAIDSFDR